MHLFRLALVRLPARSHHVDSPLFPSSPLQHRHGGCTFALLLSFLLFPALHSITALAFSVSLFFSFSLTLGSSRPRSRVSSSLLSSPFSQSLSPSPRSLPRSPPPMLPSPLRENEHESLAQGVVSCACAPIVNTPWLRTATSLVAGPGSCVTAVAARHTTDSRRGATSMRASRCAPTYVWGYREQRDRGGCRVE